MLEGVTIEQLRTLRAVAQEGSFSAAGRKLGRVQAAVSQSIDRLEAQLGLRLFDRTGRVPRLTRQGEAIVAAAGRVEGGVDALLELVESLKRGDETVLRIAVDVLFPTAPLVEFAHDFAREHPRVELVLHTDLLSAVTAHVRAKRSTWGVAVEDADLEGLEQRPIADVQLIPVAAPDHPLASHPGALDRAALEGAVQIVLGGHQGDASGDRGVLSPRTWRVADLATKQALVAGGLGWGNMPEHMVRDDLRAGRLVQLRLDPWGSVAPRRSLLLVWRADAVLGPVARWAEGRLSHLCRNAIEPSPPPRRAAPARRHRVT